MEEFVTDAINIKTYPLSENDNIVLMLTKNQGLIRGVAKGVKRPKSKLGARMQILVANKLMLRKGRNLSTISQAQAINTFNKLRSDLDRLTYSMYLAELISVFCEENSSSEDIYELFYSILEKISLSISKTEILLNVLKFQLKFMQVLGYGVELKNCLICGCKIEQDGIFSIMQGGAVCEICQDKTGYKTKLPKKILDFLREISEADTNIKTKYDDIVNEIVCEKCFGLLKRYIESRSPKKIKSLDVLNTCRG
jgi:DNA repair protein RecO (recombination protein O)